MLTTIARTSPFTGKINTMDIDIDPKGFALWQSGTVIQNALPDLTPDEREFLMTGITPEEWEDLFGGEED